MFLDVLKQNCKRFRRAFLASGSAYDRCAGRYSANGLSGHDHTAVEDPSQRMRQSSVLG